MPLHSTKRARPTPKRTLAILIACLLLVVYIGFLMASNYRNQIALGESTLERFRLDLEKRAASLGYFLSERKFDLHSLAASREISAYFVNESLGMSEQYGLKVSFFVIGQIFEKTMREKSIQGDQIYKRILLVDRTGRPLVDTAAQGEGAQVLFRQDFLTPQQTDPAIFVEDRDGRVQILLAAPCFHKDHFAGELIAWLDLSTFFSHLVDFSATLSRKDLYLSEVNGRLICRPGETACPFATNLTPDRIAQLPADGFLSCTFSSDTNGRQKMLLTRLPIRNSPLNLLAWVPSDEIYGSLTPWQLLVGTGSLALVILLGLGVLMRFNTQNLILKARFDESQRQQELLASKNTQLEDEIRRRCEAEEKLEEQRALRIRSDRLRSLGEMAAGIAHELNQPLVGVRGLAELILLTMEREQIHSQDKMRKNVGLIVEQADRMVHIINHVRLFARDAGNPETSLADLNDVVRSGMSLLTAQFSSHGLLFESEFAERSLPVRVNPFSVEEVIVNLLANARDAVEKRKREEGLSYTPRVQISTRHGKKNGKDTVYLEVKDNGKGIPQSIADKVFDPFFTTKDPDRGTGLGLSICKSIVEEFGGSIQFSSREAEGTIFTIDFPAYSSGEADTDGYTQALKDTGSG